jgi:pyruvate-formate lyase-activating enzyme
MAASEPALPPPAHPWWSDSFMVTFAFRCNIACTFCMVEDILDVFEGTSLETFQRFAARPEGLKGARRVIFSGGEVTLDDRLIDYVRVARAIPGVEHVRLQTNAIRLIRRDRLDALREAGVDEFFVSLHGHDAELCDALTQHKGSFRAIVAGLEAIVASGATLITNTAIVEANYRHLRGIVELAAPFGPRSMEFWNYWPRADEDGARAMAARVVDVQPHLLDALGACAQRGISPVVKWFPRCMLGRFDIYQDNGQPPALIEDSYWQREPEYGCIYDGVCADAGVGRPCSGLSFPYVERHGWEHQALRPRRALPVRDNPRGRVDHSLLHDHAAERGEAALVSAWLDRHGVSRRAPLAGFTLAASDLRPGELRLRFERAEGQVEVLLRPRDPARRSFARTLSFDLVATRPPPALEPLALDLLRALAHQIAPHDRGGAALPV